MNKVRIFTALLLLLAQVSNVVFAMDAQPAGLGKRTDSEKNGAPAAKKQKVSSQDPQEECIAKGCVRASLKQADYQGHGLHCGYYALWNALCSLNLNENIKVDNRRARNIFSNYLAEWELFIEKMRKENQAGRSGISYISTLLNTLLSSSTSVDNLEPNELDKLVSELVKNNLLVAAQHGDTNSANNVTVFTSKNQIDELVQGHGLSQELLERIKKFRNDGLLQAFIINTGTDNAVLQTGTNHWIAAVLTRLPDGNNQLAFHDSGFVPTAKKDFDQYFNAKKPIQKALEKLFIEVDIDVLSARALLAPKLHAVVFHATPFDRIENIPGDPLGWDLGVYSDEYICFIEDYIGFCYKELGNKDLPSSKVNARRKKFENNNVGYVEDFRQTILPNFRIFAERRKKIDKKNVAIEWDSIKSKIGNSVDNFDRHLPMLQECARQLALNKLALTYQECVTTGSVEVDLFTIIALELGIDEEIINQGIAQANQQ